jgi:hypothetical protein
MFGMRQEEAETVFFFLDGKSNFGPHGDPLEYRSLFSGIQSVDSKLSYLEGFDE